MSRLLLGNIEDGTSDDELKEFLKKYGFPDFSEIEHVAGDGTRPAVLLTFETCSPEALHMLCERIHDVFWKHRRLSAQILREGFA